MKLYPIIGLEIHVQLNTFTKLMCSCLNEYNPENPNKNICPFCTGQPGALPLLNKQAVKKALLFGQAVGSKIPAKTRWDRKNYFYPDLPTGYQISQYDNPIVEGGKIEFFIEDKQTGQFEESYVELTRAHLETDAAKLIHLGGKTMVDFNRSGCPLVEIVTEPCITSSAQAMAFVNELQTLVRFLGISEADMDKGHMRFDCNLSLRTQEEFDNGKLPNYRTETKNINSVRSLGRAIEYEIIRQTKLLEEGVRPIQETRGWKDDQNKSVSQRSKEEAMDYRYFPEPDLQILEILESDLLAPADIPKIPQTMRKEYLAKGLNIQTANIFLENIDLSNEFGEIEKLLDNGGLSALVKTAANIVTGSIYPKIKAKDLHKITNLISHSQVVEMVQMTNSGDLTSQNQSKLLDLLPSEKSLVEVAKEAGLLVVTDENALLEIVRAVLVENDKVVLEYKNGKVQVIGFLIGQCMKQSKGQGNPGIFTKLIQNELTKI